MGGCEEFSWRVACNSDFRGARLCVTRHARPAANRLCQYTRSPGRHRCPSERRTTVRRTQPSSPVATADQPDQAGLQKTRLHQLPRLPRSVPTLGPPVSIVTLCTILLARAGTPGVSPRKLVFAVFGATTRAFREHTSGSRTFRRAE